MGDVGGYLRKSTSPLYKGVPLFAKEFKIAIPQGFNGDLLWRIDL